MFDTVLDLLFPVYCQGCNAEGGYLCLACQQKINPPITRCPACAKNSFLGRTHTECRSRNFVLDGLLVATRYEEPAIRNLIWNLKYNSVKAIAPVLALILADFFVSTDLLDYFANSVVIPVPLHKRRERWRGFNQSELLARAFAARLGFAFEPLLEKTKNAKSQVDMQRAERLENVKGLFRSKTYPSLGERKVILIDDVATTGATLNECAKVLKEQKPSEVWGLVVARN